MRFAITVTLLLLSAVARAEEVLEAYDVATGARFSDFDALVSALEDADVVVIGEIHDNPLHQAMQARLVRALAPSGVAFEMIKEADEAEVNAALASGGDLAELESWARIARYAAPLAAVAPGGVVGAGQPRDRIIGAMKGGAAGVFQGDAARFDLDQPLAPEMQAEMEAEQFAAHCDALPEEMLAGMVESQRLRDAAFAAATMRAGEGGRAVLITGNGHARTDRGVPAYLRLAAPGVTVIAIAQIEREDGADWHEYGEAYDAEAPPFDIVILTAPAEREDPCAVFLKSRKG